MNKRTGGAPDRIMPKRGAPPGNHNAQKHGAYARNHRPSSSSGRQATAAQASSAPGGATDSVAPIPSIPDVIRDLYQRQKELAQWIDQLPSCDDEEAIRTHINAVAIYGQNASRIGRLIRYTQELGGGDKAQQLAQAMNAALDLLAEEFGVVL